MARPKKTNPVSIEVKALPAPTPDPLPPADVHEAEAVDAFDTTPSPDDIVADIPPYRVDTAAPADPIIEVVGADAKRNKGGRPKGYSPKKQAEVAPIDLATLIDVFDLLGVAWVGDEGALNATERSVAMQGLNSLSRTSREAITKVADKVGPVLLGVAVLLWAVRIFSIRAALARKRAETVAAPRVSGDMNGAPTPTQTPTPTPPPMMGVDPADLYTPITSSLNGVTA